MKLPNPDRAIVDIAKLRTYTLDPSHPVGGHKAIVFAALGIRGEHADWLRELLLKIVASHEAKAGRGDKFGMRYAIDFTLETSAGKATVRSGWIIRTKEDFPRLVTCYVLE